MELPVGLDADALANTVHIVRRRRVFGYVGVVRLQLGMQRIDGGLLLRNLGAKFDELRLDCPQALGHERHERRRRHRAGIAQELQGELHDESFSAVAEGGMRMHHLMRHGASG